MKKLMKKLAALALAGAMTLSLGVSALATSTPTPGEVNDWGDTTTTGHSDGVGKNETTNVAQPVKVVVPVADASLFNMVLDPHSLIQQTEASAYGDSVTFDFGDENAPNKLFFKNGTAYGPNSGGLTVVNKGFDPIKVQLDLEVNKHNANKTDKVSIVGTKAALAATSTPALYMALVSGRDSAITTKAAVEEGVKKVNVVIPTELSAAVTDAVWDAAEPEEAPANENAAAKATREAANAALAEAQQVFYDALALKAFKISVTAKKDTAYAFAFSDVEGFHFKDKAGTNANAGKVTTVSVNYDDGSSTGLDIGDFTLTHVLNSALPDTFTNEVKADLEASYGNFVYADASKVTVPTSDAKFLSGVSFEFDAALPQAGEDDDAKTMDSFAKFLKGLASTEYTFAWNNTAKTLTITPPNFGATADYDFEKVGRALTGTDENVLDEPDAKEIVYAVTTTEGTSTTSIGTLTFTLSKSTKELAADAAITADVTEKAEIALAYNESTKATASIIGSLASVPGNFKLTGTAGTGNGPNVYDYTALQEGDEGFTDFKKATFYVTGNINDADAWDGAPGNTNAANAVGNNLKVKVVWTVSALAKNETTPDTIYGADVPANVGPSAKVTTTGENSGDEIVVEVNLGDGTKKAASVKGIVYGGGNDVGASLVEDTTNKYTFNLAKSTAKAKGITDWQVIFLMPAEAGEDAEEVAVDISVYTPDPVTP